MITRKTFLAGQIIFTFWSAFVFAGATMDKPVPPTNNCNSYDQKTAFQGYMSCIINFNSQVVTYQTQVNQYNKNMHASGTTPGGLPAVGLITPNIPQNDCGSSPASTTDASAWATYNLCVGQFNNNKTYYQNAMTQFNVVTEQMLRLMTAAEADESARLSQIQPENQTTTGTLQQVQANNKSASKIYAVAGAALVAYGAYKVVVANGYLAQCTSTNWAACAAAAATFVVAYKLFDQGDKAKKQVQAFNQNAVKVCNAQNSLQTTQQNCNSNDPNSPLYEASLATPPNENWYDTSTGDCKPDAPQVCKDMMAGKNGYKAMGGSLPKVASNCAGGGTSCMAGLSPKITNTSKGAKVTMKDKNGKDISIYPGDYMNEKSLTGAGMSASAARKLLADLALAEEKTKDALADAKKAGEADVLDSNSVVGVGSFGGAGSLGSDLESDEAKKRRFKDDLAVAETKRKPSSSGLSKNFHGDLIGSSGDDIFSMMNRRYQLKNEQDTFFTP